MELYVDGELVASSDVSGDILLNNAPVRIGGGISGRYTKGYIDEVRIYSEALSSAQIRNHYLAGLNYLLAKGEISYKEYTTRIVKSFLPSSVFTFFLKR